MTVLCSASLAVGAYFLNIRLDPSTELPLSSTHTTAGIASAGLYDQFLVDRCVGGVPTISQKTQWTWFLRGSHFECVSNASESEATIDFDPRAFALADTHTVVPIGFKDQTVKVTISWYSSRGDGSAKWVISTACVPMGQVNFTMHDSLTIVGSVGPDLSRDHISEGDFFLSGCKPLDALLIQLSRRGEDPEDTLTGIAHVTGLSLSTPGEKAQAQKQFPKLEAAMEQENGLLQRLGEEIPQGYRFDSKRGVFVRQKD